MSDRRRHPRTRENRVLRLFDRLEREERPDPVIDALGAGVRSLPLGRGRDVLHGKWLGHPVHPLLVQVPIGSWLSAAVLDLRGDRSRAADLLVGVGLAAAAPAALTGAVDWAELQRPQMRVGLVHALSNTAAVGLYTASLACRATGRRRAGRTLGFLGLMAVGAGGMLGGHLAYRQAAGVNHAEAVPHLVTPGWHPIGALDDLPPGLPVRRSVDDVPLMVLRETDGAVHALADRCSHLAGPLSEGTVSEGCVQCPWHGSVFRLTDGLNVRGPAIAPQPAFEARVTEGQVEVRLRGQEADDTDGGEPERNLSEADHEHIH
ncbi:Rieske (2Fe-2S) protein [Streptomyces griseorubiginosus]|uniref:Rieske (2Fe-2S) protein n=1 Tax=Streptomyces griseorubiginosus TaxID=67304 RepID=UPI002E7FED5D|nr:Rieske (2Fe-2S) protein [Streptomyces griseorubiginosus]WUB49541.1 Rieske (2Fe-2S) protein [Streptomyces griseorubiginosus]WUB58070.1 Rieske (2Fe-2S) protein [Streptomyces griseorubiginosus]